MTTFDQLEARIIVNSKEVFMIMGQMQRSGTLENIPKVLITKITPKDQFDVLFTTPNLSSFMEHLYEFYANICKDYRVGDKYSLDIIIKKTEAVVD